MENVSVAPDVSDALGWNEYLTPSVATLGGEPLIESAGADWLPDPVSVCPSVLESPALPQPARVATSKAEINAPKVCRTQRRYRMFCSTRCSQLPRNCALMRGCTSICVRPQNQRVRKITLKLSNTIRRSATRRSRATDMTRNQLGRRAAAMTLLGDMR